MAFWRNLVLFAFFIKKKNINIKVWMEDWVILYFAWDFRICNFEREILIRFRPAMPVPLAPYPTPPVPVTPPNGGQSQLVCSGCRNLLLYPIGATSVCCAVCSAVTSVPPPGTEMAQLVCGGCHTLLMYIRGATSVQCSCCHTVNLALEANQIAHVNCGNCRMLLMYQYGARSVKCAVCNFVTSVGVLPSAEQKSSNWSSKINNVGTPD